MRVQKDNVGFCNMVKNIMDLSNECAIGNECKASPEQVIERVVTFSRVITLHRGNNIRINRITLACTPCTCARTGSAVKYHIHQIDFAQGIL